MRRQILASASHGVRKLRGRKVTAELALADDVEIVSMGGGHRQCHDRQDQGFEIHVLSDVK